MSELDGLPALFFYIGIVYPVCSWILTPGRFRKDRGIVYAIIFLAAIALVKLSMEWYERGANYYQMMGVTRNATPLEIKRAYKKISLELHPDKNPSEDAAEQFAHMKEAYDVLMDMEFRPIYDKLGPEAVKSHKRLDESHILIEMAVFYVSWGILSYLLTLGKQAATARSWIFTGEIMMLIIEVLVVLGGEGAALPSWFLPFLTEHEVIWVLHTIFPAFMNGCRSLCGFLYVDVEKQTREFLVAIKEGHQDILLVLRDMQIQINALHMSGGVPRLGSNPSNSAAQMPAGGAAAAAAASLRHQQQQQQANASSPPLLRATATGKIRELDERLRMASTAGPDVAVLKDQTSSGGGSMFWIILAVYAVLHLYSAS